MLPVWKRLIANPAMEACLRGVNATVVGILLAALYNPVWLTAIRSTRDVAVMLAALAALALWKAPPWSVVVGSALVCGVLPR